MRHNIRIIILYAAKYLGLFALARRLTRKKLRILCYHGGAQKDEHEFKPGVFMTGAKFEQRMKLLARNNYPILGLGDALKRLDQDDLPDCATVITIDDGWYGTYTEQYPVLKAFNYPATLYVASYYITHQVPVSNVALDYVLWKVGQQSFGASVLDFDQHDHAFQDAELSQQTLRETVISRLDDLDDAESRRDYLRSLCDSLGFDWQEMESRRLMSFMTTEEAQEIANNGIDLQLHTHRHTFPDSSLAAASKEVVDNRNALTSIATSELEHFCYPSGVYSASSIEYLRQVGMTSATTTDPGLITAATSKLELTRFLDSELFTNIEVEAELCGFLDVLRQARA